LRNRTGGSRGHRAGGSINSATTSLKAGEEDESAVALLETIGRQVADFALMSKIHSARS
jgi:hypothetical protein